MMPLYKSGDLVTHVFGQEMLVLDARHYTDGHTEYDVRTQELNYKTISDFEIKPHKQK